MSRFSLRRQLALMLVFGRETLFVPRPVARGTPHVGRPWQRLQSSGLNHPPRLLRHFASGSGSGSGGAGGGGGGRSGGGGSGWWGRAGPYGLWLAYLKLMEQHPITTKICTSAALNGIGDSLGQTLFEKEKPFDFVRTAKFTFLGGFLVAPVLGLWYSKLNQMIPGATTAAALGRLVLDQALFAPCFVSLFFASLLTLNGEPGMIVPKLKQDLMRTVTANWTLWVPGQFINFRFVPPELNLLFSNFLALIWSTYLSWASSRKVAAPARELPQEGKRK